MLWVLFKENCLNEKVFLSTKNICLLKLMGKKIFTILRSNFLSIVTYDNDLKKYIKKSSEIDQSTGHFQCFFRPPTLNMIKKNPVNPLIKKLWPKKQFTILH